MRRKFCVDVRHLLGGVGSRRLGRRGREAGNRTWLPAARGRGRL